MGFYKRNVYKTIHIVVIAAFRGAQDIDQYSVEIVIGSGPDSIVYE